jgi:hypothetical protein
MIKQEAEKLYFLVNDKVSMDALQFYASYRIEVLKEFIATALDLNDIRKAQGAIEELKRMRHLRDEVNNPKD